MTDETRTRNQIDFETPPSTQNPHAYRDVNSKLTTSQLFSTLNCAQLRSPTPLLNPRSAQRFGAHGRRHVPAAQTASCVGCTRSPRNETKHRCTRLSNTQRRLHANPFYQSFYNSLQHYPSFDQTSRWEENAGYQCKRHVLVEPQKTTKIAETAFEKLEQKSIEPDSSKLNRTTRHQEKRTEHLHLNLPDSHLTPSAASPDPQTIYGHACMARSEMLL